MKTSTRRALLFTLSMIGAWTVAMFVTGELVLDAGRPVPDPLELGRRSVLPVLVPGFWAGIFASLLELKILPRHVRRFSVGAMLLLRTVAYALVALLSVLLTLNFIAHRRLSVPLSELLTSEGFQAFLGGQDPWQLLLAFIVSSFVINGVVAFHRVLGPGVMHQLLLGRYLRPVHEERAFMFLDLSNSTAIAELLGPLAFSDFRNDFFHDIAEPVLDTGGQIVQYAGDEAMITWRSKRAFSGGNCARCFFLVERAVLERAEYYRKRYNVVPTFKAGLHAGPVVVSEVGDIKREISFSGDTVNTAARLEALCNALGKTLLASEQVALQLDAQDVALEDLGEHVLKGKRDPVRIFAVSAP